MKCLKRNKSSFYYALYDTKTETIDEYGNMTGQYVVKYDNPVKTSANISPATGETQNRQFGESEMYDKIIVSDDKDMNIDEHSVLWIDTMPILNDDGSLQQNEDGSIKTPHDYVVKKISKSLNSISIAISKVNVR